MRSVAEFREALLRKVRPEEIVNIGTTAHETLDIRKTGYNEVEIRGSDTTTLRLSPGQLPPNGDFRTLEGQTFIMNWRGQRNGKGARRGAFGGYVHNLDD